MIPLHIELISLAAPYLIIAGLILTLELIKKHIHNPKRRNY